MIRVGIVGAAAERGWAKRAHVPAIEANDAFSLVAVCNRHRDQADAACELFGAAHAFTSPDELVACADVDLVVVAVKVPEHAAIVEAVLAAGKNVYCEWPLARDVDEAQRLAAAARGPEIVGLQARAAPAVRLVRDLVQSGEIGEVLSATVVGAARGWGATTDERLAYTEDVRSGASMLAIAFGHAVDAFCWVLGEFVELSATLATRRPDIPVRGTELVVTRSVHDQVAVTGVLDGGAVASIHYRGGSTPGTSFLWEINGTEGDVVVTASTGQLQMAVPQVLVARGRSRRLEELTPATDFSVPEEAVNLAAAYRLIAAGGDTGLAGLVDAAARHELLARVEDSASVPNPL